MKTSAGILLYRETGGALEVLIAHMGGPFWQGKDSRAWSIPKGEIEAGEEPFTVAQREFAEEIGSPAPVGPYLELGEITQASGKRVIVYATRGELDVATVKSNTFTLEWPRGSGQLQEFPEIDRAAWVTLEAAREKLVSGQAEFLDRLPRALDSEPDPS
jgi:predicted NUDIX family NTP pyrophosphohydrolase